jgi:hypothetical protein
MKRIPVRRIIHTRDVCNFTGRSRQTAARILAMIRKEKNKKPNALITLTEFCEVMTVNEDEVIPFLV